MASGDLVVHKYVAEATFGVTPTTPALTKMSVVSSSIDAQISTTVSNQINPNRSESDLVQTEGSTSGDIGIEWQYAAYDPFIESALGGTFSTAVAMTGTTFSVSSTDNSINDSATGFSTANILPGHWIKIAGFALPANNGIARVVSVTTAKIIVTGLTFTTATAGASVSIKGKSVRNSTAKKSFTIEKEFSDIATTFVSHKGMVVNTMNVNAAVGGIVNGSFGFNGTTTTYGAATVGTGAEIAATSNEVFSPTASIGTLFEAGTALTGTCVRSINLTTTNNTRNQQCLGSLYPSGINLGTIGITGTMECYFNNTALLTKFLNATATSLSYDFDDAAGNRFVVDLPNVKFSTGSVSGIGKNSDCMVSLGFTALYDTTDTFAIQISSLAA
jgi:hypothetical protein